MHKSTKAQLNSKIIHHKYVINLFFYLPEFFIHGFISHISKLVGITTFHCLVNYIQFWHDLGVTWENPLI